MYLLYFYFIYIYINDIFLSNFIFILYNIIYKLFLDRNSLEMLLEKELLEILKKIRTKNKFLNNKI